MEIDTSDTVGIHGSTTCVSLKKDPDLYANIVASGVSPPNISIIKYLNS